MNQNIRWKLHLIPSLWKSTTCLCEICITVIVQFFCFNSPPKYSLVYIIIMRSRGNIKSKIAFDVFVIIRVKGSFYNKKQRISFLIVRTFVWLTPTFNSNLFQNIHRCISLRKWMEICISCCICWDPFVSQCVFLSQWKIHEIPYNA